MVTVVTIAIFREQAGETVGMTSPETSRADAVAWLVGRLRFEQLLADLQARAAAQGAPVHLQDAEAAPAAVRRAA